MDKIKSKVLDEIMQLMDAKDGEKLMKHPKLVAAKISIAKPVEMEMEKKGDEEDDMEGESEDMGEMEMPEGDEIDLENMDPKLLKKMLAMLKK